MRLVRRHTLAELLELDSRRLNEPERIVADCLRQAGAGPQASRDEIEAARRLVGPNVEGYTLDAVQRLFNRFAEG